MNNNCSSGHYPGKFSYKVFYLAFNLFLLYIPVNSYFEIHDFLSGTLTSWSESRSPLIIKVLKDFFLVFNVMLILPYVNRIFNKKLYFWYLYILVIGAFALMSMLFLPINVVLFGIRGNWVILFILVGFVFSNFDIKKIANVFLLIFIVHLILQIVEMFFAPPIFTGKAFGIINVRNPGIFMVPANAGAFSLTGYIIFKEKKWKIAQILAVISIVLSNSTTALLMLIFYWTVTIMRKIRYWYLLTPVLLIVIFLFITNIEFISGRGDDVYTSINSRIKIIQHAVGNIQMFFTGNGFGLATSAAVISKIPNAVISDNTIVGIYYNAGIFGVITFALFIVYAYRNLNLLFFLTFLGFGLTTVILELNPVIQIIFVMFGSQIASRSKKKQEKRIYYVEPNTQLGSCGPSNSKGVC